MLGIPAGADCSLGPRGSPGASDGGDYQQPEDGSQNVSQRWVGGLPPACAGCPSLPVAPGEGYSLAVRISACDEYWTLRLLDRAAMAISESPESVVCAGNIEAHSEQARFGVAPRIQGVVSSGNFQAGRLVDELALPVIGLER